MCECALCFLFHRKSHTVYGKFCRIACSTAGNSCFMKYFTFKPTFESVSSLCDGGGGAAVFVMHGVVCIFLFKSFQFIIFNMILFKIRKIPKRFSFCSNYDSSL